MKRARAVLAGALFVPSITAMAGMARAQPAGSAPVIALDRTVVKPGERVLVTLTGWASQVVTLSVCGNLARRGSADCNLAASQAIGLAKGQTQALAQFTVSGPPTACPCLIRASSVTQDELALAPVDLVGVPVGPRIDANPGSALALSIRARKVHSGLAAGLRSALGGPTTFEVEVSARNRSAGSLAGLALAGSVGRGPTDELVAFELPAPTSLAPGATWTRAVRVRVPAPVVGSFVWRATASGAGPAEHADSDGRVLPKGLVGLALVFIVDVSAWGWRTVARRRALGGAVKLHSSVREVLAVPLRRIS